MDLFMVLQLLCGLALFLFGMNSMGDGLESLSGGKLEKTLEKMTNSTMKGFILGAAVTAVIQSSSATTVMVVGFVNSGQFSYAAFKAVVFLCRVCLCRNYSSYVLQFGKEEASRHNFPRIRYSYGWYGSDECGC